MFLSLFLSLSYTISLLDQVALSLFHYTHTHTHTHTLNTQVYYSYPSVEEPHNNVCQWTGCEAQCQSLDDLVRHVNADHIYRYN